MSTSPFPTPSPPHGASYSTPPTGADKKPHKDPRIRRRNRLITSCLECRRRKLKCDKGSPCSNCTRFSRPCVFIAPGLDPDAQAKLAEVKEKMGMLERTLEDDVARRSLPRSGPDFSAMRASSVRGNESEDEDEDEETRDLEPAPLSTEDAAYYEDEGNDDIVDLGIAMGRVRITERLGGLVRPRLSEELARALRALPKHEKPSYTQNHESWMSPSRDYIAPSSSFFFAPGVDKTPFMTYLPSKGMVDKLIAHYWYAVHVVARTVHRPSFERQYEAFWKSINAGIEPRVSFQAVVFAALLSSITSMPEDKVVAEFGVDKQSLVDNFRHGTESALARANFLRTTKLETLQAFVMYLIPLCRAEVSRAHSALTGTCIRLGECMSLHRDPTTYSTCPVEIHVRRLIWYQLCFLDLRTCEATGPRPHIRADDYDTQFPLNIDDVDLDRAANGENVDVKSDRPYFTDMTITRMRFECYEMHRMVWHERPKMERKANDRSGKKKVSPITILRRIQSFNAEMERTYLPMLSKTTPLHIMAKEIHGILSNRLYIMILQKFASSDRSPMPERLRHITLSTCVMILDHSMTIEQQPALSPWAWYVGALHQYHVAMLLISEMYAGARDPALEVRIWRGLDFAFNLPSELDDMEKIRMILEELVGKTEVYASIRRVRPPIDMPQAGNRSFGGEEARRPSDHRERSGSLHSGESSSGGFATSSAGASGKEPQVNVPTNYSGRPMGPTLPVPEVDWGTIDLGASTSSQQHSMHSQENLAWPQSFDPTGSAYPDPSPMHGLAPGQTMPTSDADIMNMIRTGGGATGVGIGGAGSTTGSEAMNDVDWSEIEALFSGAETSTDNLLIPPFAFPQFSPEDLQWPPREGM